MSRRRSNNEGTIVKRADGRWEAKISMPGSQRRSFYGRSQVEVKEKKTAALHAVQRGIPVPGDQLTVEGLLGAWLRDSAAQRVRPTTLKSYESKVRNHLIPAVGRVPIMRLTPQHVDKMMNDQLAAGIPPRSVHHHRAVLRAALNVAMRWGLVDRNVAGMASPPPVPDRKVRAMSAADGQALLAAVRGDRLEALFTVALAAGLRQSEALGLQWGDIDLDAGTLSVQRTLQRVDREYRFMEPKTQRSRRTIGLPLPVVGSLREHRSRQIEGRLRVGSAWSGADWGDLVFCDELGAPLSGIHVTRRLKALLRAAGLPEMRYHDLRHGAATLMAAQGVTARDAMETLGHSQIATTMEIYTHVLPDVQKDVARRMERALWGQT